MPFEPEFRKHLHSLMIEVYEKTIDETEQYKRELLFKARATHNVAATPIAYMNAALYATEFRVSRMIEKYIEAITIWGCAIDETFERDMAEEFWSLTAGPQQLHFPPAIRIQHTQAVQGSYAREHQRLAVRLVREGTNRLRELKMMTLRAKRASEGITNNIFNGPVANAFINSSVVQTINNTAATEQMLDDIDLLSVSHPELQSAALEVRQAQAQGTGVADKIQKWAALANTVSSLAAKIYQHYPDIAAFIEHFRLAKQ